VEIRIDLVADWLYEALLKYWIAGIELWIGEYED
jgi:hypothetical protein